MKHPNACLSLAMLQVALVFTQLMAQSDKPHTPPLSPGKPIPVANSKGGFDFIQVDPNASRLLATHTRNGTFDLFKLQDGSLIKQCPVGATQDVAVDLKRGKYYVSASKEPRLITLDARTGEITGQTPLPGPADILAFDPKTDLAYIGHDDGQEVWVVDVSANKITASIPIPEGPEGIVCDPEAHRVYVNVRKTSEVIVIDTLANKVAEHWSTAPALSPHGLVFDSTHKRLYAAGSGKLVAIDCGNGQVIQSAEIAPKVDQIAFDAGLSRIYCASGTGVISVVELTQNGLKPLGNVPTHQGAHSVTVNPETHDVWTAYGTADQSFLLKLSIPPSNPQ